MNNWRIERNLHFVDRSTFCGVLVSRLRDYIFVLLIVYFFFSILVCIDTAKCRYTELPQINSKYV